MQQLKKKIENVLNMCENKQKMMSIIQIKLKQIVKNSNSERPTIYLESIRLMVICLVIDCYVSSCEDLQKGQFFMQMQKKRDEAVRKIRQNQSILAIQGKMRSNSAIMNSYVTATKVASDILTEKKQNITEQHLFQRLHIILTGKKLSEKCYKLVESRASHQSETISKKVKQTIEKTDNQLTQFKAIFESKKQQEGKEQDKRICHVKQKREIRSSSKILKLLKKVEQTIKVQSKKYRLSQIKQKQQKRKLNLKRQLSMQMGQKNEKQRKSSLFQQLLRKNSFRKRVGKLNETESIRFRFLELKNIQKTVHRQEAQETDLSLESILNEDENIAEGKLKIKRVFTLQMPLLVAQKCGKQQIQEY